MTPQHDRDELREQIEAICDNHEVQVNQRGSYRELFAKDLMQLLDTHVAAIERQASKVTGETSDGYHTFNELYDFRKAYNALLFNEWAAQKKYKVHKSWKHSDGEDCFGGGWFVVVAETPEGQITNHYEAKDWELFQVPETPVAHAWDGHTAQDALQRLLRLTQLRTTQEADSD